ncbi:MAG TPA: hypothetical protein VNW97_18485 [Candidatus Saccharimonadales bacterium]|jgi:hypothetical protein|nr:hypothetical protein [Candidatus Saccharimonadales bacterium]
MADPRTRLTSNTASGNAANTGPANDAVKDDAEKYVAISPTGNRIPVPKELFVALSDFMKTRKCAGSITIQFRTGEIVCIESVAKKTYRNS